MFQKSTFGSAAMWSLLIGASLAAPSRKVFAHCDGMDGPVVKAAQKAFEAGDVNLVLVWVQPKDEAEIKRAFERALVVRKLGSEAKELAETYFFETLVRVHRAGEGAPFTGLNPTGRDLGPAIPAADKAIDSGSAEAVVNLLTDSIRNGIDQRFKTVTAAKDYKVADVAAGRAYVRAYVAFVHYVEGVYAAARSAAEGHLHEAEEESAGHEAPPYPTAQHAPVK